MNCAVHSIHPHRISRRDGLYITRKYMKIHHSLHFIITSWYEVALRRSCWESQFQASWRRREILEVSLSLFLGGRQSYSIKSRFDFIKVSRKRQRSFLKRFSGSSMKNTMLSNSFISYSTCSTPSTRKRMFLHYIWTRRAANVSISQHALEVGARTEKGGKKAEVKSPVNDSAGREGLRRCMTLRKQRLSSFRIKGFWRHTCSERNQVAVCCCQMLSRLSRLLTKLSRFKPCPQTRAGCKRSRRASPASCPSPNIAHTLWSQRHVRNNHPA